MTQITKILEAWMISHLLSFRFIERGKKLNLIVYLFWISIFPQNQCPFSSLWWSSSPWSSPFSPWSTLLCLIQRLPFLIHTVLPVMKLLRLIHLSLPDPPHSHPDPAPYLFDPAPNLSDAVPLLTDAVLSSLIQPIFSRSKPCYPWSNTFSP